MHSPKCIDSFLAIYITQINKIHTILSHGALIPNYKLHEMVLAKIGSTKIQIADFEYILILKYNNIGNITNNYP